ncbi:MAG: YhjD/YihY/BrkB family envelope integrity protein, partial [Alphaproteobacteria bacterium]|nr:YhjD/YihY/BrkB family envelope integrity protein [Alphaproteobacteria bacterium]
GSVGLALLFYTIISLMRKIESAFNYSWHISRGRAFAQGFTNYISIILIGPVLVFSSLGITASIANDPLVERLSEQPVIETLVIWGGRLLPYLMVVLAFTLLYMFMPNTRVRARPALIGAAVAGLAWHLSGFGIAELFANSPFQAIYSAFFTLIIFMIWVYLSWLILLFGASLAFYVQNPRFAMVGHRDYQLSSRFREAMALAVMKLVGERFEAGKENTSADDLSRDLGVPSAAVQWALDSLLNSHLIIETAGEPHGYVPSRSPEFIRLTDVLDAVRAAGESNLPFLKRLREDKQLADLIDSIEQGQKDALQGRSLSDFAHPKTAADKAE